MAQLPSHRGILRPFHSSDTAVVKKSASETVFAEKQAELHDKPADGLLIIDDTRFH
jgi:hypothetical protein